jgi:hypothetical protein
MPQKINEGLFPPGGWKFKDATGVLHLGHDLASLVKVLANYRASAGLPPGDPEGEIVAAICKRSPQICTGRPSPKVDLQALAIYVANFISKASLFVARHGKRQTIQDPTLAEARLMACKHCPHCVDWSVGCAPCQKGSETTVGNAIHPHRVIPGSEKLACALARDSLAITPFDMNPAPIQSAPEHCWRRGPQA